MLGNVRKKFIGDKQFYKMVLAIAIPIMIQNGLTNFVNLLDNIMVGRLGTEEMSGVSIVNQIIFVYNLCIFGGTAGVGIFTAQYFGQKNDEGIRSTFRYKIWLALIITVGAAFLLLFFGKQLILLYLTGENGGNEKLALEYGMTYLRIILLDLPAFMILQVYASTMRECGETVVPMKAGAAAVAVNLIFNYLLIYGKFGFPRLGVAGAAVATVISQGVSVVLCILYIFLRVKILLPEKQHFRVGSHLYWELFSQSISMGLMSSIVSAGSVVLQYGINGLGTLVIAGHTAARKLFSFTSMPVMAMASACSTFVSQNCGANQPERVRKGMKEIALYSVAVAVLAVLLMQLGAEWMVQLISGSNEPVVLENGARYLLWNAPFYSVLGVLLATRYALQSLGQKVLPLFSSVIELVGKVVFVLFFIPKFAYNAVILCEPIIWCFMAAYLVLVYLHDPFVFPKKAE